MQDHHRIPTLDGVRGLAICVVMVLHFTNRTPGGDLANRIYLQVANAGWIGVDLFFVLSGFLITSLLLDAKGSPSYFRNFWARRALRIFPAYYACLLVWFVLIPTFATMHSAAPALAELQRDQVWFWTYLSNWKMGLDGEFSRLGTSVYWSLAIEEQFYLVWPVVVLLCTPRRLAHVCLALIVSALAIRISLVAMGSHPLLIYVSTPTRMDTLAMGALVAVLARDPEAWTRVRQGAGALFVVSIGALALICAWVGAFSEYHPLMQTAGFTALSVMFGCLVAMTSSATNQGWVAQVFSSPLLRFFGKYSYAMYLFHETIADFVTPRLSFGDVSAVWAQLARLAVLTPITVVAALLSWHLFERHFLALKRFFPAARAPGREPRPFGSRQSAPEAPPAS